MAPLGKKHRAFPSLERAWKAFPHVKGNLRVLVFNLQGQPVIQYSHDSGVTTTIDERECALGMELTRSVFGSINSFSGSQPQRIAFFFDNEVITIEQSDPFILMVFWPRSTARLRSSIEEYLNRLIQTLLEELT
jgi:hypothetical protein